MERLSLEGACCIERLPPRMRLAWRRGLSAAREPPGHSRPEISAMAFRNRIFRNPRLQIALFLGLAAVLGVAITFAAMRLAEQQAEAELRGSAEAALGLQVETIVSQFDKYRHVPALTARRRDVLEMAEDGFSSGEIARLNDIASIVRSLSGAMDAAFLTPGGEILTTATGYLTPERIGGGELLVAPLQGRLGRASLSGPGDQNAYAFSTGVRIDRQVAAIIVVAAPLNSIEQTWALSPNPIIAFNGAGRLVAGNRMARLREADIRKAVLEGDEDVVAPAGSNVEYTVFRRHIAAMDWTLFALVPKTAIVEARRSSATIAGLGVALAALIGIILILRLQEARRRHRLERLTALRLERQVRHRTRELSQSNAQLAIEVEERRLTETALRKAQSELVQSTKLAAIGQMSAALAHEYNQPLAAIRSYADNAQLLLAKRKSSDVSGNLNRITAMVDRMATLSKTLKSFARRPRSDLADVQLEQVLQDTLLLIEHRAKAAGMEIVVDPDPAGQAVRAGPVRLSQVFVNLISNAIDSNLQTGAEEILIDWQADEKATTIRVSDRGPGIGAEDMVAIFDPFFTTKELGEGLGLGLSIAYNIVQDFGGSLTAANREGGGAVFTVVLKSVPVTARVTEHA
jgi:two-component system C4-dicarboxylate transport sensor histidine kinase DctB